MAKVTLYRNPRDGVIHLRFNHNQSHSSRSLPFKVDANQWKDGKVVNHPQREAINIQLASFLAAAQCELLRVVNSMPTKNKTPEELRNIVCACVFKEESQEPTTFQFFDVYDEFVNTHDRSGTRAVYTTTRNKLKVFDPLMTLESVDEDWLIDFHAWLKRQHFSVNYISIQERNLQAVFNYAYRKKYTRNRPFDEWKIESEDGEVRDLTPEELRKILAYSRTIDGIKKRYVDMFLLQFLLLGINSIDIHSLRPENYKRGRIRYKRRKTGKMYDVKVHPLAAEILDQYKGGDHLLNWCDSVGAEWAKKRENEILREMGEELHLSQYMTSYVSRYSWSTIAFNDLDYSYDLIGQALGHTVGVKVTRGYVAVHPKKIDEANEKVISYTFNIT